MDIWLVSSLRGNSDFPSLPLTRSQSHDHSRSQKNRDHNFELISLEIGWRGFGGEITVLSALGRGVKLQPFDYLVMSRSRGHMRLVGVCVHGPHCVRNRLRKGPWNHLVQHNSEYLSTPGVHSHAYLPANSCQVCRQVQNLKVIFLVPFLWLINSKSWFNQHVNLYLIYHPSAKLWKRTFTCTQNVNMT